MVMGRSPAPMTENGCPVTLTCVICTTVEPVFPSETNELVVWPTCTEPNVTIFGDAERVPVCAPDPIIAPLQPASAGRTQLNTAMKRRRVFPAQD
jgi:hypothetical protein